MGTLLIRLAGPMQSWCTGAHLNERPTEKEPSKSALIGLLASALGIDRQNVDALADLARIKTGVRVEREGTVEQDFQIVQYDKTLWQTGKPNRLGEKQSQIIRRQYLCDAEFICGYEVDDTTLLRKYESAFQNPVFPLFCGTRSCPIVLPFVLGVFDSPLENALRTYPGKAKTARIIIDSDAQDPNAVLVRDLPLSFYPGKHKLGCGKQNAYRWAVEFTVNNDPADSVPSEK